MATYTGCTCVWWPGCPEGYEACPDDGMWVVFKWKCVQDGLHGLHGNDISSSLLFFKFAIFLWILLATVYGLRPNKETFLAILNKLYKLGLQVAIGCNNGRLTADYYSLFVCLSVSLWWPAKVFSSSSALFLPALAWSCSAPLTWFCFYSCTYFLTILFIWHWIAYNVLMCR